MRITADMNSVLLVNPAPTARRSHQGACKNLNARTPPPPPSLQERTPGTEVCQSSQSSQ